MEYLLSSDSIRIVAAADRRDWRRRAAHPLESQIRSAAGTHIPVLISAGKARAKAIAGQIHRRSARSNQSIMVVDCSSFNRGYEEMLQPENGNVGSLILLEVGSLPQNLQVRLRARLTVEARARSMGASAALVGSRLIATCSGNLFDAVQGGQFDRDLFYRLNTFHIVTA
jgi:DNA-binding NtrC family response regulator